MFTSSIRRAARSNALPGSLSSRATGPSIAATLPSLERQTHHRRHSSSKPPAPPSGGSRNIDTATQVPGKEVAPGTKDDAEKRAEGRMGKRRLKETADGTSHKVKDDLKLNLPSVPSTQHLTPNDVNLASLFSLHRPLSVMYSIPVVTTAEAFASIFAPRKSSKPQPAEVIYTLSSALTGLESAVQQQQYHQQQPQPSASSEEEELRNAVTQASVSNAESPQTHLDGIPVSDIKLSIQEFAKQFTPFKPPPAPVPMGEEGETDMSQRDSSEVSGLQESYGRPGQYSQPSLADTTKSVGWKDTLAAYFAPLQIQDQRYQENEELRAPSSLHLSYTERSRTRREKMHTISVKRQRKLKMKKHKYKKLMRRTRNLRRRLDQL